ncbi:MAG: amino acid ABC transporter substrate-binding protein, partial [Desulfuromusa sp.]|nr:amino acid ABC transporter substrate-binding protein [Desulfuromusa sp.]
MKNMVKILSIAVVALCGMMFSQVPANAAESTLKTVQDRGYLNCIIGNSFVGMYTVDKSGKWSGMD